MNNNLVTVGVALYNHENFILKCLESIVKQTYKNIELIVIDDGSPDNSFQIAKDYLESQSFNKNFKIYTRSNKGMCNTLNEIAKQANGKYISFVGSDDYWFLNKIEEQVIFLESHPHYALVHSNSQVVDNDDNKKDILDYSTKKNAGFLFDSIFEGKGGINTTSHLYRTEVYDKIGYYDPNLKFEDTDFWLRLTKEFEVGYLNKIHTFYRWHEDNLSGSKNLLSFYYEEIVKIYKKNIDNEEMQKKAVLKIYRKAFLRAIRSFQLMYFIKYFYKYLKVRFR